MLARIVLVALLIASCPLRAEQELRWTGEQISVGNGTLVEAGEALKILAGAEGKIFLSVAPPETAFDDFSRVSIVVLDAPATAQFFLVWRTTAGEEGMHQFWLPTGAAGEVSIPMVGQANWGGAADLLGLGVIVGPYKSISLQSISLSQPALIEEFIERQQQRLRDWTSFRSWQPSDINFNRGTTAVAQGLSPVQFFALLLLASLVCYLLLLRVTGRSRKFSWRIAAALVLVCWIPLDLFWQLRLGHQLRETYLTYAGKSSSEKLMSSGDAPIVQFIARVKDAIEGEAPRVFLDSANDYAGMLSAYYVAPLNTYWNRKGPKLPGKQFLASGDYILLVAPFTTQYQPADNSISLPDSSKVPVKLVLRDSTGILLRVI